MIEFMIYPGGTAEFSFMFSDCPRILRPKSIPSRVIEGWGSNRIQVEGEDLSFSDEGRGFQVAFETGLIEQQRAEEIMKDICANMATETGLDVEWIQVSW